MEPMTDLERAVVAQQNSWVIPGAIVAAGIILAVAVYTDRAHHIITTPRGSLEEMRPVTPSDHTIGNPTAPVTIVTYNDLDSSFGKDFHETMSQLMTEYGPAGKVIWAYRHFPLLDQHQYAETHGEAAECVASLAGPTSFWRFIDALHAKAPGTTQFNPKDYDSVLPALSIHQEAFQQCLDAHTFQKKVADDFENAMAIGADAAPYTIILVEGQEPQTISGAIPYETMKQVIRRAIEKTGA